VVVALLPMVLAEAYNEWSDRRTREAALEREAYDQAKILSAELGRIIAGIEYLLRAVSLSPLSRRSSADRCDQYLAGLQSAFNGPAGIGLADLKGDVFCLSRELLEPINVADRRYFSQALKEEGLAIGEYVIGRFGSVPALHFGYPVKNANGTISAVAFVPLNLEWLNEQLRSRPWPEGSVARITDRNGIVVAAFPDHEAVGTRLPEGWRNPVYDGLTANEASSASRVGDLVIGSAAVSDLAVRVGLSSTQALAPYIANMRRAAAWTLLSLCLAAGLAYLISERQINQPLRRLEAMIAKLRADDLASCESMPRSNVPEFARLADEFQALCHQIQHWQGQNEAAQHALRAARDEAIQASHAKTGFLAAASHDLRQPLHAMALTASLLKMKLKDKTEAPIAERISRSVSHLSDLVNALLDISQLDAGLIRPDISDFSLATLWEAATEDLVELAAGKRLVLSIEPTTESIRSDPRLLRRMVQNLVANAVKYTPEGGMVTLSARRTEASVDLIIADNGIGIPIAQQAEIWGEFTQLANPERDPRKGIGLGMAIVKRMADLLGHRVSLRSAEGKGTSVKISVPRASSSVQLAPHVHSVSLQGTILLVEDDEIVASSTATLLEEWGLKVELCGTTEAAIAAMSRDEAHYDAILADYRLPGLPGSDAVRAAKLKWPGALGLVVTGDVTIQELDTLRAQGVRILSKPLHADRLADALSSLRGDPVGVKPHVPNK
jgi:signal transduction histidine kinase/ActR/RegA family two-component response regulator